MDIDYLQKNIIDDASQRAPLVGSPLQPYYHGLGCIRLCMKDKSFINFSFPVDMFPSTNIMRLF